MESELTRRVWLNFNCPQSNNWIVLYKFGEITGHQQRQIIDSHSRPFKWSSDDLSHIYFTFMTENLLMTLVEMSDGQLIFIHNAVKILEKEVSDSTEINTVRSVTEVVELPQLMTIDSKIYLLDRVGELSGLLTGKERKLLGLRDHDWLEGHVPEMKAYQKEILSKINFTHLMHPSNPVGVCNQWIKQSGTILDFTTCYSLTPHLLEQLDDHPQIHQIIINQNFRINDFRWLRHFPQLRDLRVINNQQIDEQLMRQIVLLVPYLRNFYLQCCTRVNLRILISLFKLREIESIVINDPEFWCQKGRYELFIMPDEWKGLDCPSLQQVTINSTNLTLDVIDYIIRACPNIHQITVDEEILKEVTRNIVAGYQKDQYIIFNSWQKSDKGIRVSQRVRFNHLIKDTYDSQYFSESMLQKIDEQRRRSGQPEQTPLH